MSRARGLHPMVAILSPTMIGVGHFLSGLTMPVPLLPCEVYRRLGVPFRSVPGRGAAAMG